MTVTAIVDVATLKPYLNMPSGVGPHDAELQSFIDAASDVVEYIVGPVRSTSFTEWHTGGADTIVLRRRPVLAVTSVTEYMGTVSYPLTEQQPDGGGALDAFGFFLDADPGLIQRTAFGVPSWFASLPWWTSKSPAWFTGNPLTFGHGQGRVKVVYTVGRASVAAHIVEGTMELLRVNYTQTQQGGRPQLGAAAVDDSISEPGHRMLGFWVPNRVLELLKPAEQVRGLG